jgi:proteasome lid subunit RPN8/RPN11
LLGGDLVAGRATAFHPARNAEASPLRYNVHPDDLVRIVFSIEDAGEDLVAIFHSHTRSPAVPSATDRRAAQYPEVFYVLATLADPDAGPAEALRAWRIRDGSSTEVPIAIA